MFEQDVAAIRAHANPQWVDQIAHAFPAPDAIYPWHHLDALLWPHLSENEQTRRAQLPATLDQWLSQAVEHPGSWWSDWSEWLAGHGGKEIAAPKAYGHGREYQAREAAPGGYVLAKA